MGNFRKLGRHAAHRVSMLRTMVSQLVKHERIETTVAKAKEVRRKADQMVQLGKDTCCMPSVVKGRTQCFEAPTLAGVWGGISLRQALPPHKCAERPLEPKTSWSSGEYFTTALFLLNVPSAETAAMLIHGHSIIFQGTLDSARRAAAFVRGDDVVHKLFTELAYRYKDRAGGYTRLLRTRIRIGDAAPMAYIEFVDGRMNFERPNLRHHLHPSVPLLIHGPSHVPANSGQGLKSATTLERKGYENQKRCPSLFCVYEKLFLSLDTLIRRSICKRQKTYVSTGCIFVVADVFHAYRSLPC